MTQTRRPFIARVVLPLSLASLGFLGPACNVDVGNHVDVDNEDGLNTVDDAVVASPFIAYSVDSYFRKPLPTTGVPVATDSATGINYAKANDPYSYPRIRGVGGNVWGMGFGIGNCTDPIFKIASTGNVPASQEHLKTVGFHAPQSFINSIPNNNDAPIVVIDRCGTSARPGGLTVWAANVLASGNILTSSSSGTITAGSFSHNTNGLDRRNPRSNSQLNERSRGAIPDAMVIRDDLLAAAEQGANGGTLGHVLHMFWVETRTASGYTHPMVGAEGSKYGWGAEGQRIRVKESWTPPAACTGPGRVIARTLQRYGAYLGDNSGSGSGIKAQQGSTYPGLTQDVLAPCVTWNDFEFLPLGWDG
jgi:hypothetical protein